MLEMLLSNNKGSGDDGGIILPAYTGPGPQTLIGGYTDPNNPSRQHGFFGEVPSEELISGDALASAIGLIAGTSYYSIIPWLKFYIDGKIVYVPKKSLRRNISWQAIYQAGAVYGDGTTGLHPADTPVVQDAQVAIGADTFKVMLIRGANSNPTANVTDYDHPTTHGSEWNRLFYNIATTTYSTKPSQEGEQWATYTDQDLGMISENARLSWCIEQHGYGATSRVLRGTFGVSYLSWDTVTVPGAYSGWRPRLELVL